MSTALIIIVSIILVIAYQYVTVRYLILPVEPPKPVRVAGILEGIFGTVACLTALAISINYENNNPVRIFFLILWVFWISVAVSLYRGSKIGRTTCLILSILRIPTIIGILFSILSLRMLYFNPQSKEYFENPLKNSNKDVQ